MTVRSRHKIIVCILLLSSALCIRPSCWAGERNLLLYASSTEFLPTIEHILRNLQDYETKEAIFSSITNLNQWFINRLELGNLDSLVRFYESSPELRRKSEAALRAGSVVRELIRSADAYIRIDVRFMRPLLEFQLLITDSLPEVTERQYPVIVSNESRYEGFVIDVTLQDYHDQLVNSLKGLFPRSNQPPIPVVKVNKEKDEDGYYYFGSGHTAILDGAESYDPDTPPERLRFHWCQRSPRGELAPLVEREIIPISASSKRQVLFFESTGEYHFGLSVSDGIADSRQEIVKVKIIDPPCLSSARMHSVRSKGWCSDKKFRVPFSMFLQQGDTAEMNPLAGTVTTRRSRFLRWILGEPPTRPLGISKQEVRHLEDTSQGKHQIRHYELVVGYETSSDDQRYDLHIAAEDCRGVGDTLDVMVDFRGSDWRHTVDLVKFTFSGDKDTATINKDVVAVRYGAKIHLYKDNYFEFGAIKTLWEEDIPDSLDIFTTPHMYLSVGHRFHAGPLYISVPFYITTKKIAIGANYRVGAFSIGLSRYGHKHYSFDASGGSELSSDTWGLLFMGWFFLWWASL